MRNILKNAQYFLRKKRLKRNVNQLHVALQQENFPKVLSLLHGIGCALDKLTLSSEEKRRFIINSLGENARKDLKKAKASFLAFTELWQQDIDLAAANHHLLPQQHLQVLNHAIAFLDENFYSNLASNGSHLLYEHNIVGSTYAIDEESLTTHLKNRLKLKIYPAIFSFFPTRTAKDYALILLMNTLAIIAGFASSLSITAFALSLLFGIGTFSSPFAIAAFIAVGTLTLLASSYIYFTNYHAQLTRFFLKHLYGEDASHSSEVNKRRKLLLNICGISSVVFATYLAASMFQGFWLLETELTGVLGWSLLASNPITMNIIAGIIAAGLMMAISLALMHFFKSMIDPHSPIKTLWRNFCKLSLNQRIAITVAATITFILFCSMSQIALPFAFVKLTAVLQSFGFTMAANSFPAWLTWGLLSIGILTQVPRYLFMTFSRLITRALAKEADENYIFAKNNRFGLASVSAVAVGIKEAAITSFDILIRQNIPRVISNFFRRCINRKDTFISRHSDLDYVVLEPLAIEHIHVKTSIQHDDSKTAVSFDDFSDEMDYYHRLLQEQGIFRDSTPAHTDTPMTEMQPIANSTAPEVTTHTFATNTKASNHSLSSRCTTIRGFFSKQHSYTPLNDNVANSSRHCVERS